MTLGAEIVAGLDLPEPEEDRSHLLPDEFWAARPYLTHIRVASKSRLVSPDAVFGGCLARVAAISPHTVELPPTVATPVGLTFYAALVGPPEAGKSAAANIAGELIPAPSHVLDRLPIGTGEGMVEVLFEMVDEPDEKGKSHMVKQQTKYNAIFHVDEGQVLTELANRKGTTLLPTLRSAWSHSVIGNTNASAERRRLLRGTDYVYGITLGIQPERAGPLLDDEAGGTPQRFMWFSATDPDADPDFDAWPGALPWGPPSPALLDGIHVRRDSWGRHQLRVDPTIRREMRYDRAEGLRGAPRDTLDAHRMLGRLKVAALLALLDGRVDVTGDDWELAAVVVNASRAVRDRIVATLRFVEGRREEAATQKHVRRELEVVSKREYRFLSQAAASVARRVRKDHDSGVHEQAGCGRACLTTAINGNHRKEVGADAAIDEAERQEWIVRDGGRWCPGPSRPA